MDSEIYYVDPTDRDQYISIEKYFNYLKIQRISELQKIAQSLGPDISRWFIKKSNRNHTEMIPKVESAGRQRALKVLI